MNALNSEFFKRLGSIALMAVVAMTGACSDDDSPTTPGGDDGDTNFGIVLRPDGGSSASFSVIGNDVPMPNFAQIPLEDVEAITVTIGEVEAHRVSGGGWVDAGRVDATINLLDLPEDGITLVESELEEGDYNRLRLFLTGQPTITLLTDVTVGRTTFEAGDHPLVIPSGDRNGLRVRADFTVDPDGETLTILFDDAATVRRVTATGSGVLKIAPELRVLDDDGDEVGEDEEEDEDGDEGEDEAQGLVASVEDGGFTFESGLVVLVGDDTEIDGDLLTLEAVAEALAAGEVVMAEAEGTLSEDGSTLTADEVEFELEGDDDREVEGVITAVDRDAGSFTVAGPGASSFVVFVDDGTVIDAEGDFTTFDDMADAFDAGTEVRAEAEGTTQAGGSILAATVKFETDEDDGS